MLFTIAVPVHNGSKSVVNAVKSCLSQDFNEDYEVLVVDNASTDDTVAQVKSIEDSKSRLRLIEEGELVNVSSNHNRCLKEAKGDYIVFCHADDALLTTALRDMHHALERRRFPERYILWGHSMFRDFQTAILNTHWRVGELIVGQRAYTIFLRFGLTPSGTCYPRKSFLDAGGFIEFEHWYDLTDQFTMISLAFKGFSFEMAEQMFFERRIASRAKKEVSTKVVLEAFGEGVEWLKDNMSFVEISLLLDPRFVRLPPLYFWHCFSYHKGFQKHVAKACMKWLAKNPTNIRHGLLLSALFRSVFSKGRH